MRTIQPLKQNWKLDEDGDTAQQIKDRVNSEDNYTHCKGYFLVEFRDIPSPLCPRSKRSV